MKPPVFDYQDPATIDEVLDLLIAARADTCLLAGGQSLMPLLNLRRVRPELLIDLNRVAGLDRVSVTPEAVTIGATARLARLARDPEVAAALPALPRVISFVAHPQIRTRTTIGGSLSYADPAAELPALAVPLSADVPDIVLEHVETPSRITPGGFKGLGESGIIPPPAAIGNALAAAVPEIAEYLVDMPLTPVKVWDMLDKAGLTR